MNDSISINGIQQMSFLFQYYSQVHPVLEEQNCAAEVTKFSNFIGGISNLNNFFCVASSCISSLSIKKQFPFLN